jgi:hypothetical protein
MKRTIFLAFFLSFVSVSYPQISEIGFSGGVSYYNGDLNPLNPLPVQYTHPTFGFHYRYYFNSRLAISGTFVRGTFSADDNISKFIPERNIAFSSKFNELAAVFEYHFLHYLPGSTRNYFTTYIFGGLGILNYNPVMEAGNRFLVVPTHLPLLKGSVAPVMPFGIGFKYSLGKRIGLSIEWGERKTLRDDLDGTEHRYEGLVTVPSDPMTVSQSELDDINMNNLDKDPGGQWIIYFNENDPDIQSTDPNRKLIYKPRYSNGDQKSNSTSNDWYSYIKLTISYKFNLESKNKCRNNEYEFPD